MPLEQHQPGRRHSNRPATGERADPRSEKFASNCRSLVSIPISWSIADAFGVHKTVSVPLARTVSPSTARNSSAQISGQQIHRRQFHRLGRGHRSSLADDVLGEFHVPPPLLRYQHREGRHILDHLPFAITTAIKTDWRRRRSSRPAASLRRAR